MDRNWGESRKPDMTLKITQAPSLQRKVLQKTTTMNKSKLPFVGKKEGYPTAAQWADPNYHIPGWRVLGSDECPQRGDVAAYSYNFSDASGHVAIVVDRGHTVGANAEVVHKTQFGFNPQLSHNQKIVFRRYEN